VQTVVTSPPYFGLRDYGEDDQIGLESTPKEFIEQLCLVFDEVWRVLKDDGTIWVNLGDSYSSFRDSKSVPDSLRNGDGTAVSKAANRNPEMLRASGLKHKDLIGIPWRFAFAMQERGWYLRQDIIWAKPNPMPESVTDRCTKSHEYIFLMTKSPRYFYDHEAIKEEATSEPSIRDKNSEGYQADYPKGERFSSGARVYGADGLRNKRDVWNVAVKSYKEAHFATYPPELITPCILAGSKEGDIVLDPFSGSGTTGEVALQHGRNYIGLELNPEYAKLSEKRLTQAVGMFGQVSVK
jgi:DNA modification methylase